MSRGLLAVCVLGALLITVPAWAGWEDAVEVGAVETILGEAENQSLEGMTAVGEVIRTRARREGGVLKAIYRRSQFSCWNRAERAKTVERIGRVSPETLQKAWRAWWDSDGTSYAKGATHYHHKDVMPWWAVGKRPCAVIGAHRFYKNID